LQAPCAGAILLAGHKPHCKEPGGERLPRILQHGDTRDTRLRSRTGPRVHANLQRPLAVNRSQMLGRMAGEGCRDGDCSTPARSRIVAVRIAAPMICAGTVSSANCQDTRLLSGGTQAMAASALPFYDWGACPYETCAYREWTAHRSVTAYDTWEPGRRAITQLAERDKVTGVTGVVVTFKPG
jgi:hypothetical protein